MIFICFFFLEFKTPIESSECDFIREKDPTMVTEFINNENAECHFSP